MQCYHAPRTRSVNDRPMSLAIYLLAALGCLGAFDTLYYHERCATLPALGRAARCELQLHAWRDFVYALLFATLPWAAWQGRWGVALAALLLIEVVLKLWDFVVEDWIREPLGGLYAGERLMHAIMGIVYGAMLARLVPILWSWWSMPTVLTESLPAIPEALRWTMLMMAASVFLSGVRDFSASNGWAGSAWPWKGSLASKNASAGRPKLQRALDRAVDPARRAVGALHRGRRRDQPNHVQQSLGLERLCHADYGSQLVARGIVRGLRRAGQ